MKKAIFWDYDGTLVHSEHLWSNSLFKALKTQMPESTVTLEEIRSLTDCLYTWDTPDEDFSAVTGDSWWKHMQKQFCSKYLQVSIPADIASAASEMIRDEIMQVHKYHLYDDTISTLENCIKLGYRNYILSNNYPELEVIVDQLGIAHYFDDIIVSAKIGYDKPRIEIFQYALQLAEYPDVCYMAGDNPIADIYGAKQAGLRTILVHREEDCDADYSFPSLAPICDIVI